MALALRLPLSIVILAVGIGLTQIQPTALAAGLDAKDKATLKEATVLYKQGQYEEAAKLLTKLAVDHPEMASLQRNLGACYYYLRRAEPALSNLRDYLAHRKADITAEDKVEVERWIDEMEKLRAQGNVAPVVPVQATESQGPPPTANASEAPPAELVPAAPPLQAPQPAPAQPGQAPPPSAPTPSAPQADAYPPWQSPPPAPQPAPSALQPAPNTLFTQPTTIPAQASQQYQLRDRAAEEAPTRTNGSGLRIAGIACGAVGLASIGAAIYFYTRASSLSDKVSTDNPASASDYQAGKDAETMQWVFYSVGAGAIATGAVLYLLGHYQSTAPAQMSLAPIFGPGAAGLSARGAF
jgi:tetratricopeptide (TPR) repeat protein